MREEPTNSASSSRLLRDKGGGSDKSEQLELESTRLPLIPLLDRKHFLKHQDTLLSIHWINLHVAPSFALTIQLGSTFQDGDQLLTRYVWI